jgi:hypothetical protein
MNDPLNDDYTHKINNSNYIFKVTIISVAGETTRAQDIKPSAIKSLIISDAFTRFYTSGSIVIDNSFDVIERDTPEEIQFNDPEYYNKSGNVSSNINAGFLFRGESRDILRIDIMPQLEGSAVESMGSEEGQRLFRMSYDFAIYNSEEITGDSPDQKFKKLYFWDLYYQLLLEKNVNFTTATIPSFYDTLGDINTEGTPSGDDGIETGIALMEFLKAAFPPDDGYPVYFSKTIPGDTATNTSDSGEIDPKNIDWDIGGTKLFFSSPANFKAIDCINYILSRHVSNKDSDFDQCFLHLERYPRQFALKSIKQYFDQAYNPNNNTPGSLYVETVKIGGYTGEDGRSAAEAYFVPAGGIYFERFGTVKSFSFDNMAGLYSQQKIVPYLVHSYDYQNKQFNIDIERNGIEQSMQAFQKNYVNKMNSGDGTPAYPNFAPGQFRFTNKNIQNVFSLSQQDHDQRLNMGRKNFLYNRVLLNNMITFRLPGLTHRQSGCFIGIDRDGAIPSSKFDNKLLGIYMIVEVRHIFEGNEYYTDIHCVKTYNFKQLDDTFNDAELKGLVSNGY